MRITVIFNPTAGEGVDASALKTLIAEGVGGAGNKVRLASTEKDWRKALRKPADLVVGVGGDGAISEVALELANLDGAPPMAILPFGTANNVGKTLGLVGDARSVVESWTRARSRPRPLDIGRVAAPWGETWFVESFGAGALAALIASRGAIDDSSLFLGRETDRALHHLDVLLANEAVRSWSVTIDGASHDGRYLAVEILNIKFVGPNLPLAPDADPGDGLFEVVLMGRDERRALRDYAAGRLRLAAAPLPEIPSVRGSEMRLIAPAGAVLHADDDAWPDSQPLTHRTPITVTVEPGAIQILRR